MKAGKHWKEPTMGSSWSSGNGKFRSIIRSAAKGATTLGLSVALMSFLAIINGWPFGASEYSVSAHAELGVSGTVIAIIGWFVHMATASGRDGRDVIRDW